MKRLKEAYIYYQEFSTFGVSIPWNLSASLHDDEDPSAPLSKDGKWDIEFNHGSKYFRPFTLCLLQI